jgi:superoxide dismutase, Cu-Zn family
MRKLYCVAIPALPLLLALGCSRDSEPAQVPAQQAPMTSNERPSNETRSAGNETAHVTLKNAQGDEVGKATLRETEDGVKVMVEIENAPPGSKGIHVHEKGDCSNISGKSMGDHFAPDVKVHALPSEESDRERHLGDLGNVDVNSTGTGELEITVKRANLEPNDALSYLGRALVVHSGNDQGEVKQPAGDSGAPMACGVIEAG